MRHTLTFLALTLIALLAAAATAVLALLATLAPGAGAWKMPLRVTIFGHPLQAEVGIPVLLRLATHPLAAPVLRGRQFETSHGRWQIGATGTDGWSATCAPCRIGVAALGPTPLRLEQVRLSVRADGADQYHGSLQLGPPPHALQLSWRGRIDRGGRMQLEATLPATPLQQAVQVFGADLPERDSVRVDGTLALTLKASLPDGPWQLQPRLERFVVHGMGTERLLDLQRPAACRDGSDATVGSLSGWLPRAVIAAEDQHFFEHPGYDLAALTDAWQHNQQPGAALAGASTLTQQLAKLVITGDERSAARKLRELLVAVEMERTLGKARILQLYLALAPWGDGVCGAERAVHVHLGQRSAATVGPVAAAWLASLLPQPDALLRAEQERGAVNTERVARVLQGMRTMSPARREQAQTLLLFWSPPSRRPREAAGPVPAGP
ncbi:MAG: biosynthetic peptidoglycan transglycosylase [Pseudomonadota bacterium]